jgi:glycosyltransferase involved in cell wall biosynthesis
VSDFVRQWPKKVFNGFLVNRLHHVISVSELCRQDFIETYHFNPGNTTTIPIGIEAQPINTSIPNDLKDVFAGGKVLVHVGSFVREKNHAGLLRIFQSLAGKVENAKLLLVGDGGLRPEIERQILEMGHEKRVLLLGQRNDVLSILSNADALLLPSRIEGLPGVILESMGCHTPVVAYDVGGISEVVKNGETGWLIKADDEAGFCTAVESVLKGNVDAVKANAFRMVTSEFDNRTIARRFLEVYQRVAS